MDQLSTVKHVSLIAAAVWIGCVLLADALGQDSSLFWPCAIVAGIGAVIQLVTGIIWWSWWSKRADS